MSKQIVKIELEGKIIGSKPLLTNDSLTTIREKIKEKTKIAYIFLDQDGNDVSKGDENDYTLENIVVSKIIRIKPCEIPTSSEKYKVILNDKFETNLNCSKEAKLEESRKLLLNIIKEDFIFIDSDGNDVEKVDESDYKIENSY